MTYENVKQLYEDWIYSKNEDIEAEFFEINEYRTSMRGLKVRGVYDTYKEASTRAQVLRRKDPSFNVFVGQVGYWLPWDPECEAVPEQEYQENQLNELVKKYKENLNNRDDLYEQVKNERIEKAKKEVNAKKEIIKAQQKGDESTLVQNSEEESVKNIEQLRTIVDESDKLYYDNLKKNESNTENNTESNTESNTELNNFKSESMQNLEEVDPWLSHKKNN
jgi:hypothetical protein